MLENTERLFPVVVVVVVVVEVDSVSLKAAN